MSYPGQCENGQYQAEVMADSSGHWYGNELRFDTAEHARDYAIDLWSRWILVRQWRVIDSNLTIHHTGP